MKLNTGRNRIILGVIVVIVILVIGYYFIFIDSPDKVIRDIQRGMESCLKDCPRGGDGNSISEVCLIECEDNEVIKILSEYSEEERLRLQRIYGDPLKEERICWDACKYDGEIAYQRDCVLGCFD